MQAEDFIEQLQRAVQEREAIIPPEVESQIKYLSEENHRLNLLIENYISEIKHLKVNIQAPNLPKVEYKVPADIESRITTLTQENSRLTSLVSQLQSRPVVQSQPIYQPNIDTSLVEEEYAKAKFRTIVLLEEINRLNFALQ
jgi:hypothetical protein